MNKGVVFKNHVVDFVKSTIKKSQPDWIVVVERKGTAILRLATENGDTNLEGWGGWSKVLSHESIKSMDYDKLKHAKFLLLEDSVLSGSKLNSILSFLVKNNKIPRENIKIAAFCAYKDSSINVDYKWYSGTSKTNYREVNSSLINLFQESGSLLLDTEHIEVLIDLKECGRLEFFQALSHAGAAVEHASEGNRINLTIFDPVIINESSFIDSLPKGSIIKNCVKKIRVVERARDQYAIIPIFYPSIPISTKRDELKKIDSGISELATDDNIDVIFNLVGMYAAVELLKTVFTCLAELYRTNKIQVRNPLPGDNNDTLSHILALFPMIDVNKLHKIVQGRIDFGTTKHPKSQLSKPLLIDAGLGTVYGSKLEKFHQYALERILHFTDESPIYPKGASMFELFEPVRTRFKNDKLHISESLLSAAIDQAIDKSEVHAVVAEKEYADGQYRKTRIFTLDNELTCRDLRIASVLQRSKLSLDDINEEISH